MELTDKGKLYVSKCFRHYCPVVVEVSHCKKMHVKDEQIKITYFILYIVCNIVYNIAYDIHCILYDVHIYICCVNVDFKDKGNFSSHISN